MRVDCNLYRRGIESAKHIFNKPGISRADSINAVSMGCGAPLIAVCQYALQYVYPDDVQILATKERLIKFYTYTEIIPFQDT